MSSPEAAVAIAGVLLVTVLGAVALWQVFATWRSSLDGRRESSYKAIAEDVADSQRRTAESLERVVEELTDLRTRTGELERMIKEVS